MTSFNLPRLPLPALTLATLCVLCLGATQARACDKCGHHTRVICYRTVYVKVPRTVCYTKSVTCYDDCGHLHVIRKTYKRTRYVTVRKVVSSVKYVPIYCD